jgi:hypothetical protein
MEMEKINIMKPLNQKYETNNMKQIKKKQMSKELVKVGDKVIADDTFISLSGFIDGEVIEVTPYKNVITMSNEPKYEDNRLGVKILGKFKRRDFLTDVEYEETRRISSCDFMVNPTYDVNTTWGKFHGYAEALFFTSQEIKDDFNESLRIKNMNYHLNSAKNLEI